MITITKVCTAPLIALSTNKNKEKNYKGIITYSSVFLISISIYKL